MAAPFWLKPSLPGRGRFAETNFGLMLSGSGISMQDSRAVSLPGGCTAANSFNGF